MLELIIYLVIGGAFIALLAFLFIREGQREEQSRPQYAWEKAVEDYGDPTLLSLYRRAKTDEERLEIASFVNPELNSQSADIKDEEEVLEEEAAKPKKARRKLFGKKKAAAEEELFPDETSDDILPADDPYLEHTTSYNKGDLAKLWAETPAAQAAAITDDKTDVASDAEAGESTPEEDDFSIKEILSAPAYNFWQEPAVEESPQPEVEPMAPTTNIAEPDDDNSIITNIDEISTVEAAGPMAEEEQLAEAEAETQIDIATAAYSPIADNAADETAAAAEPVEATPPTISETILMQPEPDITEPDETVAITEPVFIPKHLEEELCPVCGNPLEPDCAFCIICGTRVKEADEPIDEPIAEEPVVAEEPQQPIEEHPKGKRRLFGRKKAKAEAEMAMAAAATTAAAGPDIFAADPRANAPTAAAATCPVCGAELEPGFTYCIICGEAVGNAPAAPTPAAANNQAENDFWSRPAINSNPPATTVSAPVPAAINSQPAAAAAPDPDVVAAYRASTANAYAAAAAKGMVPEDDFVPPIKPAAYQSAAAPAAEPQDTTPATPVSSTPSSASEQPAVDYSAMTLQDILENVKALERRIMVEAEAANHNSGESQQKADQQ